MSNNTSIFAPKSSPNFSSINKDEQLDYEKIFALQKMAEAIKAGYSSDDWVRMVIWPNSQSKAESWSLQQHDKLMAQAHSIYLSICARLKES